MLFAAAALAGCKGEPASNQTQAVASTPDAMLSAINDSLGRMNYGEAAGIAARAQTQFPGDHRIHTAAARVQARLGDAVASAAALERAVSTGIEDVVKVVAEPAFDTVRNHSAFAPYRTRVISHSRGTATVKSHIRAGDVSITETSDGDVIRAGDLVLDTRR